VEADPALLNMLNRTKLIRDFGTRSGARLPNCRLCPVLGFLCAGTGSRGLGLIALTCSPAKTADGTRSAGQAFWDLGTGFCVNHGEALGGGLARFHQKIEVKPIFQGG